MWRHTKKSKVAKPETFLKQTLIFQDLDFQKSRCRLKGRQSNEHLNRYILNIVNFFSFGLLICALISENQCLGKSRSVSNLRNISGPAHLSGFGIASFTKNLVIHRKKEERKKKTQFIARHITALKALS